MNPYPATRLHSTSASLDGRTVAPELVVEVSRITGIDVVL